MKVIKIGGTALSNSKSLNKFYSNLKSLETSSIVVVSALGKLSSELKKHFNSSVISENYSPFISTFTEIRHLLCQKYLNEFDEYALQCQKKLTDIIKGCIITDEFSAQSLDKILVLGELVSSFFIYCLLKSKEIQADFLDIRGKIVTNSEFGNASPSIEISSKNISSLSFSNLTITQGFIASDTENRDTTMGFESSNLSATIIAKALDCDSIDIYTKVNQIHILNPDEYETEPVTSIPYKSAKKLAICGHKMLFPGMIELAESKTISIRYKGLDKEEETIINESVKFEYPVIINKDDSLIITPISKYSAISVIKEYSDKIDNFKYKNTNYTLEISSEDIDKLDLQNYIISLLRKH
ncbi:MAG: hypothetical protein ACE364_06205 [Chlorobiota bacterium]